MRADALICSKQPTLIKVQSERLAAGVFHLRTVARFSDGINSAANNKVAGKRHSSQVWSSEESPLWEDLRAQMLEA